MKNQYKINKIRLLYQRGKNLQYNKFNKMLNLSKDLKISKL